MKPSVGGEPTGGPTHVTRSGCATRRSPASTHPRPGSRVGPRLSRHLGPVCHGKPCQGHKAPGNIAPRIIRALKPPHNGPENQALRDTTRKRAKNYVMKEGGLHYICKRRGDNFHLAKVVLSAEEASDIFKEFHSSPIGGHCGWKKTHRAVIDRYYWPGMQEDIKTWVSEPFELVGMDLVGKLTKMASGYQYICVMIDYFSKWPEAYPLRGKRLKRTFQVRQEYIDSLIKREEVCSGLKGQQKVYEEVKTNLEKSQEKTRAKKDHVAMMTTSKWETWYG
ncbi:hypothetical protein WMY93_028454 [Mugilogobius chulae]|uniref:Gypsy retrotransposon integrase-like protein 1 n=1 Tax=Mugilogobius chulae TaxID=88201 RepID=A0AAW0MRX6_9GOBI